MSRKPTGKRLRFEILKRDGFRCIYCGATPVQRVLRVDHVVPVVEGGTDAPENLATSCFDCNAGKAGVPLDQKKYEPMLPTKERHDHVEQIRKYLAVQRGIAVARTEAVEVLAKHWEEHIGPMSQEMYDRLGLLMQEWPHDKLIEAIEITARKMGCPEAEYHPYPATKQAKYFHGILRRWREGFTRMTQPAATGPA